MKRILILFSFLGLLDYSFAQDKEKTYCNPMELNYRFQLSSRQSYREAADPVITIYKGKYFLYASHSGGYWYSDDMLHWEFLPVRSLPIEDYAPDVITINDTTYYMASSMVKKNIYYTLDPFEDNWKPLEKTFLFCLVLK